MSRHVVARNVLTTLATQVITLMLAFAVTLYLPRYVGDVGLGELTTAASLISVFFVFVPLGTSFIMVKEIARDRSRTGELLGAAVVLRTVLGIIVSVVAVACASLIHSAPLIRPLTFVYACSMLIGTINGAFSAALQGQENMPRQSLSVLVDKFLLSALTIALILHKAPLWMLAGAVGVTATASLLVNMTAFRSLLGTLQWPRINTIKILAVSGLPFMGWIVFQTLYGQTDPIILRLITNSATVGWYSAAFRLIGTTLFLPSAITLALMPTLARMYKESTEADFHHLARRTLALVMLCAVPISLVCVLLPGRLIALMHYPATFSHSIPVLQVGGVGVLLWFAANVLGTLVIASDGQSKMLWASIAATIIGIPACIAGTYITNAVSHNGAVGAMFSDVVLELFMVACYVRMLPPNMFDAESVKLIAKCVVAAIPMAVFIWYTSLNGWGFWIAIPGIAIYGVMCWVLGCIGIKDFALARQAFAHRLGPAA